MAKNDVKATNKFVATVSASDANIKSTRAANLGELASIEASTLVQNLKREKLSLENKIANMTDLSPETTFSLRPGGENFDAAKWVKELHKATMELKLKVIELTAAEEIFNEWFGTENA
jgi:hypothetical protein